MAHLTNEMMIIMIILVAVVFYMIFRCNSKSKEGIEYPQPKPGDRPSTGDFLLTVGDTPAKGGYAFESGYPSFVGQLGVPYTLNAELCQECVNHSVDWIVRNGLSKGQDDDRARAEKHCDLECRPGSAF